MEDAKIIKTGIKDVKFGKNVTVYEPVNLYGCKIGNDCVIGPFVEVQKRTKIGDNCKIQSHSFICEMVEIGDNCFISHGVVFINDRFSKGRPAMGDEEEWEKTIVGNNVSIGSNATILPVNICSNVVIGAGSVVVKSIEKQGIYAGNPARFIRDIK